MIDFETAIKLGEEVLASLDKLYQLVYPTSSNAESPKMSGPTTETPRQGITEMPSLLQFRRMLLALHARRHLVTELTATGKLSQSEAQSMVDAGSTSSSRAGASGSPFGNILAWLQANGPTIAQDIAAAIPIILSLITLFGG
jgi:hypothetical protein